MSKQEFVLKATNGDVTVIIENDEVKLIQYDISCAVLSIQAVVVPTGFSDPEWKAEQDVADWWGWGDG